MEQDEQLEPVLIIRIPPPAIDGGEEQAAQPHPDPTKPPIALLSLLSQVQISLEATYIASAPIINVPSTPRAQSGGGMLAAPPMRTESMNKVKLRPPNLHPSIFPPATPHPTPAASDADQRYIRSEGTLLINKVWGEDKSSPTVVTGSSAPSAETFALLWSEKARMWFAVYRITLTVGAYMHQSWVSY
jgi:hypothetical protein